MTGPIPLSNEPSPPLLCWPTELLFLEGLELQLNLGVMRPFSELIIFTNMAAIIIFFAYVFMTFTAI